ncbi:MAG: hypothetical protein Greene041679_266 [Parcubacteria group bacterium Greene0416_79]|nr:MAG: hypothetical protein Greene041679_266 [Parcubacteria group bacterium Greene0416_79]
MQHVTFETQSEIFERIVRNRNGRVFRVRFVAVERGGILRGRIVSCEEIVSLSGVKDKACRPIGRRGLKITDNANAFFRRYMFFQQELFG